MPTSEWKPPWVDGRTKLLGIVGDPIEHSLSPALHNAVLAKLARNWLYVPVPVSIRRLPAFLRLGGDLGFIGCNVTTPYKEAVIKVASPSDAETARVGMANTLSWKRDTVAACGTDGAGILAWMKRNGLDDRPFGVLGFGATARSLVHRAWAAGHQPELIVSQRPAVVRRQLSRWKTDPRRPRLAGAAPEVASLKDLASAETGDARSGPDQISLWVSTWPPGVIPPVELLARFPKGAVVLDMNYGEGRSTLAAWARDRGFRAADGLGPLVEQAALSMSHWVGEAVPTDLYLKANRIPKGRIRPVK